MFLKDEEWFVVDILNIVLKDRKINIYVKWGGIFFFKKGFYRKLLWVVIYILKDLKRRVKILVWVFLYYRIY